MKIQCEHLAKCLFYVFCTTQRCSLRMSVQYTPEQSVGWWSSVGNVVEKNLQFIVIIKVGCDDSANRRWHGKLLCGDVLAQRISAYQNLKHHSVDTLYTWENHLKNVFLIIQWSRQIKLRRECIFSFADRRASASRFGVSDAWYLWHKDLSCR